MAEHSAFRLPGTVLPLRYDVTLTPDLEGFTFASQCRRKSSVKAIQHGSKRLASQADRFWQFNARLSRPCFEPDYGPITHFYHL